MTDNFSNDPLTVPPALRWCITLAIPMLLAAGILEKSRTSTVLPEKESYRSNLSDMILESSEWRSPKETEIDWREPPPPLPVWRIPSSLESSATTPRGKVELFPRYKPGNPADFDYLQREEKPQIKVFEFGR